MYKKLIIILAVAFVASARQVSDPELVGDKVDDLLQKLKEIIDTSVAKAREEFKVAEGNMNKTAAYAESEAANFTQYWPNFAKEYIGKLKDEARVADVNIDDCLGKDEQTFLNLAVSIYSDVKTTVDGLLTQMIYSVNGALIKIERSNDDVAKIQQDIKDCRKSSKSETCLEKLANKIEEEIVQLPKEITEEIYDVKDMIDEIKPNVQYAGFVKIREAQFYGRGLEMKIAHCVDQKIKH